MENLEIPVSGKSMPSSPNKKNPSEQQLKVNKNFFDYSADRFSLSDESLISGNHLKGFEQMNLFSHIVDQAHQAGWETPTPLQARALPLLLDRRNIVAVSETEEDKTRAGLLAASQHLAATRPGKKGFGLVLVANHENAERYHADYQKWLGLFDLDCFFFKDLSPEKEWDKAGVIIATFDEVHQDAPFPRSLLENALFVYIHGTGEFLELEIKRLQKILEAPGRGHIGFFLDKKSDTLFELIFKKIPEIDYLDHRGLDLSALAINQRAFICEVPQKFSLLLGLLEQITDFSRPVLVYVNKRAIGSWLKYKLEKNNKEVYFYSTQTDASEVLSFLAKATDKQRVLVASDTDNLSLILERFSQIILFDLPTSPWQYFSKVMHYAPAATNINVFSFVCDEYGEHFEELKKFLGTTCPKLEWAETTLYTTQDNSDNPFFQETTSSRTHRPQRSGSYGHPRYENRDRDRDRDRARNRDRDNRSYSGQRRREHQGYQQRDYNNRRPNQGRKWATRGAVSGRSSQAPKFGFFELIKRTFRALFGVFRRK